METSLDIIDLRHYEDHALLTKVYTELYATAFTDPSEVETLDQYATRLWQPQLLPPQPVTHFLVAGKNLHDPSSREVDGFLICESYRKSLCGLMTFIVIHDRARGKGLARKLISYGRSKLNTDMRHCSSDHQGLQALFAEMHNPRQFSGPDIIDPNMRLQIMRKLGAHWVPIQYIQPELQPGAPRSHHLLMTAFPTIDKAEPIELSRNILKTFLFEFYQALGVEKPELDNDYLAMIETMSPKKNIPNLAPELPTVLLTSLD